MKTTLAMCLALAVPVGIGACASDQNKKVQQAGVQEAEAQRQQSEKSIEATKKGQVGAIEQQTEETKRQAEAYPQGTEQRAKAQAEMTAEHQKYQAETQARVQKLDARLAEARRKMQIAGSRVPTSTRDKVDQASRETASVTGEINRLGQVRAESWSDEKKRIDARLDQVEALVGDAESKVNDAMP